MKPSLIDPLKTISTLNLFLGRNLLKTKEYQLNSLLHFTIHENLNEENQSNQNLVYISEKILNSPNPVWAPIWIPSNGKQAIKKVKFTVYCNEIEIYSQTIDFESLELLCFSFRQIKSEFPTDTFVFKFKKGFYTSSNVVKNMQIKPEYKLRKKRINRISQSNPIHKTQSIDQLLNVFKGIRYLERIKSDNQSSVDEIGKKMEGKQEIVEKIQEFYEKRTRLKKLRAILEFKRKVVSEKRQELKKRKDPLIPKTRKLVENIQELKERKNELQNQEKEMEHVWKKRNRIMACIVARKENMLRDLRMIFPIKEQKDSRILTISGIPLPITDFEKYDPEMIASAFGYVAHLLNMLSKYLETPLRYPVNPRGSRSTIRDEVTNLNNPEFPLYLKNVQNERFQVAVLMINKNIQQILNSRHLNIISKKHTLANLLTFFNAGTQPKRKTISIKNNSKINTSIQNTNKPKQKNQKKKEKSDLINEKGGNSLLINEKRLSLNQQKD
ncbi:uv radiation resistance-associated protein [Anaeramoeba flamelloides]|uniref:Uv radiation resistance-associated protein n=1 Tax=Anaeramoeba flamelloides TaxID=1746091 RepID=A0AAV8AH62_9EUKA|nr:uv radiation resistance-associated protein [Anaeramoeba flamelloides]